MTCQQITQFLLDYLEGELPQDVRVSFEAHVEACVDCRNYIDGYRKTVSLSKSAMQEPIPENIPEPLVRAIVAAAASRRS